MPRRHSCSWAALLWFCAAAQATDSLGFLDQSFYFDYNVASQAVPVPVTTQCQSIHLEWSRGAGVGPNPTAPYYLQVYTSAFVFPFIVSAGSGLSFDWEVPFGPGTLYQICMFDANGNTGGCEAVYTMIANTTATPSCNNVTFPLGPLDVDGAVSSGPLSQYGWIDQCSDIQVTPKNGTPPYIFTVAPALHPPHNMTGKDQSPMNWTVSLSWGSPFFISVVDADMNFWSYGPLHSGEGTSLACLSGISGSDSKDIAPTTAVASGVSGLLVGLIAGAVATFLFFRQRRIRERDTALLDPTGSDGLYANPYPLHSPNAASSYYKSVPSGHLLDPSSFSSPSAGDMALHRMQRESSQYQIEPFSMPGQGLRHPSGGSDYHGEPQHTGSPTTGTGGGNVYVVHHDGGRAPVTVYHQDGTEVVELPPRYAPDSASSSDGPSEQRNSDIATERRTSLSSHSIQDILTPQRRPNRPGKP
ncbi:hypothetical protein DFH07DRAFT_805379 [Mycena maculata]|uniref:Uncharacterized protein n=1 Tax=Mycena maculata TaxID=230809 RepID=A0AAD7JSJ3_9AGAR|nr:hypothetical protein DFH07DRAFT_805379 [Mycena maculata]